MERLRSNEAIERNILTLYERFGAVSFDADGVLIDSAVPVFKEATRLCGATDKPFIPEEINQWQALYSMAIDRGFTEETAKTLEELWYTASILKESPVIPGALPLFERFTKIADKHGYQLPLIITSRNPDLATCTASWFEEHAPWLNRSQIVIRTTGETVSGTDFKAREILKRGVGLHFEDSEPQAMRILDICQETHLVYLPYGKTPNNIFHPRVHYIPRTSANMREVYKYIARNALGKW